MVFCSNQADVDLVHEYLLLKGVDAVSIHGGKGVIAISVTAYVFDFIICFLKQTGLTI